jgi:dihydroflavonol-4-reductase
MKALVTGAAGFIGSHVARLLVERGHEVRALHLPGEDLRNLAGLDCERFAGDVTDEDAMRRATTGHDWVFHLAAIYALWTRDPARLFCVNVEGTRTVLEASRAAGVRRVIHTSSIARFGGQGRSSDGSWRRATEDSPFSLGPTGDLYSRTKAEAHELAVSFARAHAAELDVVLVAPCGPIGPGDVGPTPTGRLLLAALQLPAVIVTDTVTNFAHVRDMAAGHLLAAERGRPGECYLLGHENLSLVELARRALARHGLERPIFRAPPTLARLAARVAAATAELTGRAPLITPAAAAIAERGLAADCQKAVRELGLPQTPIDDALADALHWFAENGYLRNRALRRAADGLFAEQRRAPRL